MIVEKYICDVTGEEVSKDDYVRIISSNQLDPVTSKMEYGSTELHLSHQGALIALRIALKMMTHAIQVSMFKHLCSRMP